MFHAVDDIHSSPTELMIGWKNLIFLLRCIPLWVGCQAHLFQVYRVFCMGFSLQFWRSGSLDETTTKAIGFLWWLINHGKIRIAWWVCMYIGKQCFFSSLFVFFFFFSLYTDITCSAIIQSVPSWLGCHVTMMMTSIHSRFPPEKLSFQRWPQSFLGCLSRMI